MSGIFGFTRQTVHASDLEDTLRALDAWNQIYGSYDTASRIVGSSGIGCRVEHFSELFPAGTPILERNGLLAVIDALLFNREELIPMLSAMPDSAVSDEDLLFQLILERGYDALAAVNGDFAGAVYDPQHSTWTLFRDHLGVRPLFIYQDTDLFAFSTDIRGLLAVPGVDTRPDEMNLYKYMIGVYNMPGLSTDYERIKCLQPGSYTIIRMTRSGFRTKTQRYWRIRSKKIRLRNDDEYRSELRRLVTDAVQRRCDAIPGTLGAELSGGLDSGVIDILINRYGREAVYYSWCLSPEDYPLTGEDDERHVVNDICSQEGIRCRYISAEDRFDHSYVLEQVMPPYATAAHLSFGSRWMRDMGAKAVFSGHGGDEGVSHRASRLELLYNGEILSYFKLYWNETSGLSLRLLRTIHRGLAEARAKWKSLNPKPPREMFTPPYLDADFCRRMKRRYRHIRLPFAYSPHKYIELGGTRQRLDNGAFHGAFCGVRYLFPFVDHRVMDFAVSVPRRLHVNNYTSRVLFRETFADLMPQSLRNVNYKDLPSERNIDTTVRNRSVTRQRCEFFMDRFDPDYWNGYLCAESIHEMLDENNTSDEDRSRLVRLSSCLIRCIMIQNTVEKTQNRGMLDA